MHANDSTTIALEVTVTGTRSLTGTFGKTEIAVPRARLNISDGKDDGAEEPGVTEMSAPHAGCRRADRGARIWPVPIRAAHVAVEEVGKDMVGRVAPGEGRLGRLEFPLAGRRADRAPDSRRHCGSCGLDRQATSISLLVVG
jgi:hypothetical protein